MMPVKITVLSNLSMIFLMGKTPNSISSLPQHLSGVVPEQGAL